MSHQTHCPLNTFKPQGWVSAGDPPSCTCNEGFGQIGAPFNLTHQEKGCCDHTPTTDTAERKTYPWCQDCKNGFAHSHTTDTAEKQTVRKIREFNANEAIGAPTTETSDWRERFDVLFKPIEDVLNSLTQGHGTETFSIAKAFIAKELEQAREDTAKDVGYFGHKRFEAGRTSAFAEVRKIATEILLNPTDKIHAKAFEAKLNALLQALSEALPANK